MTYELADYVHQILNPEDLNLGYHFALPDFTSGMAGLRQENDVVKTLHQFDPESQDFSSLMEDPVAMSATAQTNTLTASQERPTTPQPAQDHNEPVEGGNTDVEAHIKTSTSDEDQPQPVTNSSHGQNSNARAAQAQSSPAYPYEGENQRSSCVPQGAFRTAKPAPSQRARQLSMSSQGDPFSDEERRSLSSLDATSAPSRVVGGARSNQRMGMEMILQQHNISPNAGRRRYSEYQPTGLRHEINQDAGDFSQLMPEHPMQMAYVQHPGTLVQPSHSYHDPAPGSSGSPISRGLPGFHTAAHRPYGSPPGNASLVFDDTYQHLSNSSFDRAIGSHGIHSREAAQHLFPYGGDANAHIHYRDSGFNHFKRENFSPEMNWGLPENANTGHAMDDPEKRTLKDLEPDAAFPDPEDKHRLEKLYRAMIEEDQAQDNEGMRRTWKTLRKDKPKLMVVCRKVLNACYVSHNVGTQLQFSVKPQHHYDSLDERIDAICEAFKQQKTMCKHLMEAPYLYQVVDDPNLAAIRVINNRKVNRGKKEAIEQGRRALAAKQKAKKRPVRMVKSEIEDEVYNHDEDADYDEDDDFNWDDLSPHSRASPARASTFSNTNSNNKRARRTPARRISSDDSADPTYRGSPQPQKKPRKSSKYQLNDVGVMVDKTAPENQRGGSQSLSQQALLRTASLSRPHRSANIYKPLNDFDTDSPATGFSGYSDSGMDDDFQPTLPLSRQGRY